MSILKFCGIADSVVHIVLKFAFEITVNKAQKIKVLESIKYICNVTVFLGHWELAFCVLLVGSQEIGLSCHSFVPFL